MEWSEAIKQYIQPLKPVKIDAPLLERLVRFVDLTSLNESDTDSKIATFLEKAETSYGNVASVCVYPRFVRLAATQFAAKTIRVGSVANFPEGNSKLETVLIEIGIALQDGAQEIDVVFPYARYLAGERQYASSFVEACKAACGDQTTLKVILETGVLSDAAIIADAAFDAIKSGADFIKTSTGKLSEGATLESAATMLLVIQHMQRELKRPIGLKVSGGIKDIQQAAQYLVLAEKVMGKKWPTPATFRIGSSSLVDKVVSVSV